jgi:hypothetical protein
MRVGRYRLLLTVFLLCFILVSPVRNVVGEEEESSIPVHFLENKEISLDLYPAGFQSAAVLTGTGIDGEEYLYPIRLLIVLLANQGVKGTVFLTTGDTFRKNLAENRHWVELLSELSSRGFEIAQNRYQISGKPGNGKGFESGSRDLSPSSLMEGIKEDREFLVSLGDEPDGYRGYGSPATSRILPILEKMGYLYFCAINRDLDYRDDQREDTAPDTREIYFYPEGTAGLDILKFYALVEPAADLITARRLFNQVSQRSGVMICNVYLPGLRDKTKLAKLRRFITYLKEQKAWICSLRELSRWWNGRRKVGIKTRWDNNTLVITYDNPTRFLLKNARLNFKELKIPTRYYRVENRDGIVASQGIIPDCRSVNVTLFSTGPDS